MECILCSKENNPCAVKQYYDRIIKGRKEIRHQAYVEMLGEDHVETYMYCSVCI